MTCRTIFKQIFKQFFIRKVVKNHRGGKIRESGVLSKKILNDNKHVCISYRKFTLQFISHLTYHFHALNEEEACKSIND